MAMLRQGAAVVVSALLLLAVVITVHNDVKYRTLHPNTATAELLGVAPAAAAPKTATTAAATSVGSKVALKASNLQAKLAAVDVGGDLSPAVVQKLADKMVKVPKSMKKSDVVKAAEDITKVIQDGKLDDESVKSVLADSRTHGGKDSGSTSLFKELHAEASAKKGTKSVSLSADISSALDVGKAHNKKQIKLAHEEALAIAKVIQQSKEDLSIGKIINKHSKSKGGTKDWDNFWNSKHSLVSRLAAEVGKKGAKPAAKGAKGSKGGKKAVVSKAQQVKAAHAALAAKKAHEAKMSKVPEAIRKMWDLLAAAKKQKK